MNLIVGLGNPGRAYAKSRHNVGFQSLDHFARIHAVTIGRRQGRSLIASAEVAGVKVILAKPQTYMNLSGEAVGFLARYYSIPLSNLLVIHDDLDLPLGIIRVRKSGGSGGHKGMQSIIENLGSREFPRLRIGIGRPEEIAQRREEKLAKVTEHVLTEFSDEEKRLMEDVYDRVAEAIMTILTEGIDAAMNRFNRPVVEG